MSAPLPRSAAEAGYAAAMGAACHLAFAAAVAAMMFGLASGMTLGIGRVPAPWSVPANVALSLQFIAPHSWLLSRRGGAALAGLGPRRIAGPLSTTTYVLIVSLQVTALFVLWTPSGTVWWRAHGALRATILAADVGAWLLLLKAIWDAGIEVQTGLLGWLAVLRGRQPVYPPMPQGGLFRLIRQPIYLAFALTTWATPQWTPDQLAVAVTLTAYCALGPLLKEARLHRRFGARFDAYRAATPYWTPRLARRPRPGAAPPQP